MKSKRIENVMFRNATPKHHKSVAWIHADGCANVSLIHKPTGKRVIAFRNL